MLPGPRRSARDKAAEEKAMKESEEGAARYDSDAEDAAAEDSEMAHQGPDPGRAQLLIRGMNAVTIRK